jgi:PleD family two-component response regulator
LDDPNKIDEALLLGAHAYLLKPIRHLYLSAAVERCLQEVPAKRGMEHRGAQLFVLPSSIRSEKSPLSRDFKS